MVHKRDIRHDPSGDVVDLSGAVQAMELNNELDPEEGGARRAGVQYHKNKIGKERTGVTHLCSRLDNARPKGTPYLFVGSSLLKLVFLTVSNIRMALLWFPRTGFEVAQLLWLSNGILRPPERLQIYCQPI